MQLLNKGSYMAAANIAMTALLVFHACSVRAGGDGDVPIPGVAPAVLPDRLAQLPVSGQGMRVYRDPQTRRLGPPPSGLASLELTIAEQRMLDRSDKGLQSRTLPSGGAAVDLQGRYRNMVVATVSDDGQAEVNCVLSPDQATTALQVDHKSTTGPAD